MKKIILLFLTLSLFVSCDDDSDNGTKQEWNGDWNDPSDRNYKPEGYNPIQGDWRVVKNNNITITSFVLNRYSEDFIWRQYEKDPEEGGSAVFSIPYIINNKAYRDSRKSNSDIFEYTLNGNTLKIKDPNTGYMVEMTRYNSGIWEDDWNNPNHPKYQEYQGKYNPIEGEWLIETENDKPSVFILHKFTTDFKWLNTVRIPELGKKPDFMMERSYQISNKQIRVENVLYNYSLSEDVFNLVKYLTITDKDDNITVLKSYDSSIWNEWNGDWNDANNPNYLIYEGNYNPLEGEWTLINENNSPAFLPTTYIFTNEYSWEKIIYDENGTDIKESITNSYIINDKAYYDSNLVYQYDIVDEEILKIYDGTSIHTFKRSEN